MTVQVGQDGKTQIDLRQGSAEVQVKDTSITLGMGERIAVEPGGAYHKERVFWPNAQLVRDRIQGAWSAPGETFQLELPEDEVNQFLVATSQQPDFIIRDPEIWFTEGEARIFATLVKPAPMDVFSDVRIEEGRVVAIGTKRLDAPSAR